MPRTFEVSPQVVQVGPAANGVSISFGYDPSDHSIVKMIVTPTGTLAAATELSFNRGGRNPQSVTVNNADKQALAQQAIQGGPEDSGIVPRGTIVIY